LSGTYKPGFNPAAVASPLVEKHGVQLISKVLSAPRSLSFEEFKAMGKEIMVQFVGETVTKLSEGFVGGEENCFKWIQFTLQKHLERVTPPQGAMMIPMKVAQYGMALKASYAAYKQANPVAQAPAEAPTTTPASGNSGEPDVLGALMNDLLDKSDLAKIMMGKSGELDHLPPKAWRLCKKLRDQFG
jgi:hypothetical protein